MYNRVIFVGVGGGVGVTVGMCVKKPWRERTSLSQGDHTAEYHARADAYPETSKWVRGLLR